DDYSATPAAGVEVESIFDVDGHRVQLTDIDDNAVWLQMAVKYLVCPSEGLNQPVIGEYTVEVQRVEPLGVVAGEQLIDNDDEVDLLIWLILDAFIGALMGQTVRDITFEIGHHVSGK